MKNVMSEDISQKGLPVEEVLKNAPDQQGWTNSRTIYYGRQVRD